MFRDCIADAGQQVTKLTKLNYEPIKSISRLPSLFFIAVPHHF